MFELTNHAEIVYKISTYFDNPILFMFHFRFFLSHIKTLFGKYHNECREILYLHLRNHLSARFNTTGAPI